MGGRLACLGRECGVAVFFFWFGGVGRGEGLSLWVRGVLLRARRPSAWAVLGAPGAGCLPPPLWLFRRRPPWGGSGCGGWLVGCSGAWGVAGGTRSPGLGGGLCPDGAAARLGGRFGLLGPGVAGSGFCLLLVAAFFWVWVWVRWGSVWWLVGLLLLSSSGRVVAGVVCRCLPLSAVVCRGRGRQTGPGALLRRLLPLGFGGVGWGCLAPPCGPFARRVSP